MFKYWKGTSSFYVNELFVSSRNIFKARPHMALKIPLRKSNLGQNSISFMGPSIWNKSSNDLKLLNTATWFNRNYKKLVLKDLEWVEHNFSFISVIITETFIIINIASINIITFWIIIIFIIVVTLRMAFGIKRCLRSIKTLFGDTWITRVWKSNIKLEIVSLS